MTASWIRAENFLHPQEAGSLLREALTRRITYGRLRLLQGSQHKFCWRSQDRSILRPIEERIIPLLPQFCYRLALPLIEAPYIDGAEVQGYGDEGYRKIGFYECQNKTKSVRFFYFLHSEPPQFAGGETLIYQGFLEEQDAYSGVFLKAKPRHNSLIVFPGNKPSQLLPVRCPSKKWANTLFLVTGLVTPSPGSYDSSK